MTNKASETWETGEQYEIHVKGVLGGEWSEWFDGMTLSPDGGGNTIITGPIADQAALYGILDRVRDLGLTLLAIRKAA